MLERLANMAIELFATASTISRTQRIIETGKSDAGLVSRSIALCDLFCVTAGLRFRSNRIALETEAVDDQRRVVAAQVRERAGYSIPGAVMDDPAASQSTR